VEYVRWHARPTLRTPVVVAAFTGWNDAADAASGAVRALIEGWGAQPLATIDPEEFTDFAVARPHVRLSGGVTREIVWPQTSMWSVATPGGDVILVLGPEPSLRWRTFCEQIVGVATEYDASLVITLGALLADVAHTSPVPVMGSATEQTIIERFDLQRSQYQGPTGIVGVLHDACNQAELASASLWAATPAYASSVDSPKAALALIRRATDMIGTPAPVASLALAAESYEGDVDTLIADNDELVGYVRRLQDAADDDEDDIDDADGPAGEPSGDQLIEELEQFLRDQGSGDKP
jgi:proteasome assembly chaperone (PAC2) family protein